MGEQAIKFHIDIRLSKDNEIVMMHDMTLNRTTTGSGRIHDHKWYGDMDQLHMRASPHSPITRLKDVIDLILQPSSKDIYMIIDIKVSRLHLYKQNVDIF